jgi:hypothetical protein
LGGIKNWENGGVGLKSVVRMGQFEAGVKVFDGKWVLIYPCI